MTGIGQNTLRSMRNNIIYVIWLRRWGSFWQPRSLRSTRTLPRSTSEPWRRKLAMAESSRSGFDVKTSR